MPQNMRVCFVKNASKNIFSAIFDKIIFKIPLDIIQINGIIILIINIDVKDCLGVGEDKE